jgi:broad specificity phosphatase PhoE
MLSGMTRRLVLVRHGESTWNAEQRMQGQADPPLSDHGREQVLALRPYLERLDIVRAVSSDLARAVQTAELLGLGAAGTDVRWREIDLGAWAGKRIDELDPGQVASWRRGVLVPPKGEMWPAFRTRVAAAITALPELAGDHVVVTHGGCVRAACARLASADRLRLAPPANASLTIFELGDPPRLQSYGLRPPLRETPGIS